MIKSYHSHILQIYEKIREDEQHALEKRKAEIANKYPYILDYEQEIAKLCVQVSLNSLRNMDNREIYLSGLKEKITDLRMKKVEALVLAGYPTDYLDLTYRCTKCKDTGYVGNSKCSCYKQKLVNLYYKDSDLNTIIKNHNFDYFNLDYYSQKKMGEEPDSPRKNMEKILSKSLAFIKHFPTTDENLLFYGNSGTGKTFLSHCIAKELLDRGVFVVYRTAEELITNLRKIRFENDLVLEELLLDCDLLIIDDLGTEQINDFSRTELFNLLNKRLLKNKKLLVSTNYSLKDLLSIYSERITSRLFGNFTPYKFYGEDIRVTKNLNSIKNGS